MTLSRPIPYDPVFWTELKPLNVDNLDTMDYGVLHAYYQSQSMWLVDDSEEVIVYDGDDISEINLYENASTTPVLRRKVSLTYTGDDITEIDVKVYKADGTTIFLHYKDTLSYTGDGNLDKVTRSVEVMPGGE